MCGITGIFAFNEIGRFNLPNLSRATSALEHRGPDHQNIYLNDFVGLGHRRLSIIDLSSDANQPMSDHTGRYHIVFNGEIFNFLSIKKELADSGVSFTTESDTEVFLKLLIHEGVNALPKLNGFFAFAFYDAAKHELIIGRDRMGIKPVYLYEDEDKLLFASELSSILAYGIQKDIEYNSLITYLQLNYLPAPFSMLKGVRKLNPGHYLLVRKKHVKEERYYNLSSSSSKNHLHYDEAKTKLKQLLEDSVESRMIADVPLGSFLSGGVDSSVIASIASRKTNKLHTFSIGYKDQPFFDETEYALAVAKKIGSQHHVFKLTFDDLYERLDKVLKHFSEPFADSSALAVYTLSQKTKEHVTVALSGDGADELFAGYNKHAGLFRMANPGLIESFSSKLSGLWRKLPKSRNNKAGNLIRQLHKFSEAYKLTFKEQYWLLLSLNSFSGAKGLLNNEITADSDFEAFHRWQTFNLNHLEDKSINSSLLLDQKIVLEGDMLPKVDLMSMAHALEVRVPFLDHRVVDFANSLPEAYKIQRDSKKKILQDAFRDELPAKIYNRPKHGFEVPLLDWFRTDLKQKIESDWLNPERLRKQKIFNVEGVNLLKQKLYSNNPEDAHAHIWALIVFQEWYSRIFE